jgi:hypothetical protein
MYMAASSEERERIERSSLPPILLNERTARNEVGGGAEGTRKAEQHASSRNRQRTGEDSMLGRG